MKNKKYVLLTGLIFIFLGVIASPTFADITVTDYLNRQVTVKKPVKRIVALAPHIVENIFSAGAGEFLVAAVDHCDYPKAADNLPKVGSISSFSLEAIIAQKPDLVVVWHSGRGADVLSKLNALNITTYASDPRTLNDVAKSIRDYGMLAATSTEAEKAAVQFETTLEKLQKTYQQAKPISTLYQVWNNPIQTLNNKHIISDVIALCGGVNAFGDSPVLAPKISVESVIARNPQAIVASGMGEERPDWLNDWKKWPSLQAVKYNQLYFIPPDIIQRHTVRILQGAQMLCEQLQSVRENQ